MTLEFHLDALSLRFFVSVSKVTGGSNGIGREICLQLAMDGCNVAVLDLDAHGAERTCCDIRQFGVTAMPYKVFFFSFVSRRFWLNLILHLSRFLNQIDVGDYNQVVAVKKLIDRDMGACDILVNNAGLMPKLSLREGQPEDIARILNVNVASHFWVGAWFAMSSRCTFSLSSLFWAQMVRVFIEDMIARRRGHIVAIASMIAFYPTSQAIAYTTTKFAVKGFMEALNQEIRDEGYAIKTSTIFPHFVNTRKEVVEYVRDMLGYSCETRIAFMLLMRFHSNAIFFFLFSLPVRLLLKRLAF